VYKGQIFKPLTQDYTLRFRTRFGLADSYGGTDELPFFENFYGGGFGSVRGYKRNTLGPRGTPALRYKGDNYNGERFYVSDDGKTKLLTEKNGQSNPLGGNGLIEGSMEFIFPMPFVKDQSSMQPSVFLDGGNVFDTTCSSVYGQAQKNCSSNVFGFSDIRFSTGIGLTWITGFGPLTFSVAKALNAGSDDESEFFQFSLGQQL
jgi:outer membrane protein insertion porin family